MAGKWIDFRVIKEQISMKMVLDRYGIDWLRTSNEGVRGQCPIHKGQGNSSFHASLAKNVFQCFSCGARGNILDFVVQMERCTLPSAALKLVDWFALSAQPKALPRRASQAGLTRRGDLSRGNMPLGFELKGLDHAHQYLISRGIDSPTAETFGVGFFRGRGCMQGRVVIPIHNSQGDLVAYAGRSITGAEPKYLFPRGFHKSYELYNLHRITGSEVVLVEGFFDCIKTWQYAQVSAIALMGCSLSEQQEQTIVSRFRKATLLLDGDEAGRKAAKTIRSRLGRAMQVRVIELADGRQPDQFSQEEFRATLKS